jgi:biotin-[acetyl-CoA-carboxylase] ligase BirA-like protein
MEYIGKLSQAALKKQFQNVIYFEELESTSSYVKENFETLKSPTIVITDLQTKGRGRNTNTWTPVQKGDALYATWFFKSAVAPDAVLPMRVGLTLHFLLSKFFQSDFSLKAPNDIYNKDGKVAGILIEGTHYKNNFYTYIGIGINVSSSPNLPNTSYLTKNATPDVWSDFITSFSKELDAMIQWKKPILSSSEISLLLKALQKHPSFKDLLRVGENGDLIYKDRQISWMDL